MIINDNAWVNQDLAMANALRDYGFTSIWRAGEQKLLASFDFGPFPYEIPWLCFPFLQVGHKEDISDIVAKCEDRCR